jgi:hypothetical protein
LWGARLCWLLAGANLLVANLPGLWAALGMAGLCHLLTPRAR